MAGREAIRNSQVPRHRVVKHMDMPSRRDALGWVGALAHPAVLLLLAPLPVIAQVAVPRRIGYLAAGPAGSGFQDAFRAGMRDLGWAEGRNISIEFRFADTHYERLPELAAELVRLNVEVIVAQPTAAAYAARGATKSIPIVMVNVGDPVRLKLVDTLGRPGGNATGTAFSVGLESIAKSLQLFRETVPNLRRLAVLSNPANPAQPLTISDLRASAKTLGLELLLLEARQADEFDAAFAAMTKERVEGLLVVPEAFFILHGARLAELASKHRIPTMHGVRQNVDTGGLMSYGPRLTDASRRAASYVDRILKGAKPADLPIEQPSKFDLVINLKTARALGLAIPQSVLLRADEVIEE
ncbi:MAG: ABC transporter substrate-binding protein [Burkholderiaceae bacterium]|nr:ABC transporter substrate-binding protein [Burkholderiaceae bacterium]